MKLGRMVTLKQDLVNWARASFCRLSPCRCLPKAAPGKAMVDVARHPGVHPEPEQRVLQQVDDAHVPQRSRTLCSAG